VDRSGNVFIGDTLSSLVVKVAAAGGVQSTVGGFIKPNSLAADRSGNIFIADYYLNVVVKLSTDGAQTTVATGLGNPTAIAVDQYGNLFIAEDANNRVLEISSGGSQTALSGLNRPFGVAVDGDGDIFIADSQHDRVVKVPADGGPQTTVTTDLHRPYALTINGAGDLLIADTNNARLVKIPAGGGDQITVAGGLAYPYGVAVDAANNIYLSDSLNNRVLRMAPDGSNRVTITSGLDRPGGLVLDGSGNVFVADIFHNRVLEVQRSTPRALSFADTAIGQASSSQSVTVQNIRNQLLNAVAPGITVGANFQQTPGSGTPADCTANFSLAEGASCNLSISFNPQTTGTIQSAAVLTDNHMNAATAIQSIPLSGAAILATSTLVSAANGQYSDKATISAVVGPADAKFSGNLQFRVDDADACLVPVTGGGTYTCSYSITQAAGSHAISAVLTVTDSLVQGSNGGKTLTVSREDASILPSSNNPSTVEVNTAGGTAGPITLQGAMQQAADGNTGDISKALVSVALVPVAGAANIICPVTNTNGALSATCSNVPVDAYTVQWSIGGNYFQGAAVKSVLAVYDPSLGFATGSGSVRDGSVAADFAVSVRYLKNGTLSGGITYIEHRATGDVRVSSTTLSSMSLVGTTAIVNGQATVNGVAGYTLQLTVTDNGTPGINRDTLGLQVIGGR
jgi:sugar lactone lactonase YvrE